MWVDVGKAADTVEQYTNIWRDVSDALETG
jgi:hypothetical protein